MIAEQVLAKIGADTTGLRKGVQESNTLLRSLSSQVQSNANQHSQSFSQMVRDIKGYDKAVGTAKSTFLGFIAATGAIALTQRAWEAAKNAVMEYNSVVEQANIGFTTMLGSAQAAGTYLKDLEKFAAKTPFQFTELIGASQRLMALGFSAENVLPMLRNVGDAVAALGGTMQDAGQRVIRALGQMSAKGKVSAEEMMQLSEAGIGAWQYLADAYGVTTAEMMERTRKTVVDSSTAIQAILAGMGKDFGGMMEAQSKTLQGAMSNVVDYMEQAAGRMTLPIYEAMRDSVLKISQFMGSAQFEKQTEMVADRVASAMDKAFARIGDVSSQMKPELLQAWNENKDDLKELAGNLGELGQALGETLLVAAKFAAELATIAPPVAITALKAVTAALTALGEVVNDNEEIVRIFMGLFVANKLMGWLTVMRQHIAALGSQAAAHLGVTRAVTAQTVATNALTAAQIRQQAAANIGFAGGIVPGLGNVQRTMMIGGQVQSSMTMMQKTMSGLRAGLSSVASGFSTSTAAMGIFAVGLMTMAENSETVQKALAGMTEEIIASAETAEMKYRNLTSALSKPLPTNRDLQYSGGFMSDIGAGFTNLMPGNWFGADKPGGSGTNEARDAIRAQIDAIKEEVAKGAADARQEVFAEIDAILNEIPVAIANAKDGVADELAKMKIAEEEGFNNILDPFQQFRDQVGINLEDMMRNMYTNLEDLGSWQANLQYMLDTGNADIAAYFAELGPMSNEALSDLIHGTPQQLADFKSLMKRGFELTGEEAEDAMWGGLSKIPSMAERVGFDFETRMKKEIDAGAAAPKVLTESFQTELDLIKENAGKTIKDAFGASAVEPDVQAAIAKLTELFQQIDPEDLWKAGITEPAILKIGEMQTALAQLAKEGRDNPIEITFAAQQVLQELGYTKEEIEQLVNPTWQLNVEYGVLDDIQRSVMDTINDLDGLETPRTLRINAIMDVVSKIWPSQNANASRGSSSGGGGGNTGSWGQAGANGLLAFANGGLPNTALIQPPGTLIQWAEPETGGEAFIPLAQAKRDSALKVWGEVGRIFGIFKFADGGIKPPEWDFGTGYGGGSGSGKKKKPSGSPGAQSGGIPSWDMLASMYEFGDLAADAYLKALNDILPLQEKWGTEWTSTMRSIQQVEQDVQDEREALLERQKQMEEERLAHSRMIEDNMYTVGQMSGEQYKAILQERLAGLEMFSDDWTAVWQEIIRVDEQMQQHQRDIIKNNQRLEDNMFEVGVIGAKDYENLLQQRLNGLAMYSDEWMAVWRTLTQLQEQELAKQEATQKQYIDSVQKVADALRKAFDEVTEPIKGATSLMDAFGGEEAFSITDAQGFYSHMIEATGRWTRAIRTLKDRGLNPSLLRQLIQRGPESLAFAEALVQGGSEMMSIVNSGQAEVDALTRQFGGEFMDQPTVTGGTTVNIGDITIDLGGANGVDANVIYDLIEEAFDRLAQDIQSGVTVNS